MKKILISVLSVVLLALTSTEPILAEESAAESKTMLFHLKTSLKHDDAQICVRHWLNSLLMASLTAYQKPTVIF